MKKLITLLTALCLCIQMWAVPAKPVKRTVQQSDGTTLVIMLNGDEDFHFYTTLDGIPVVEDANGSFSYATVQNGLLAASSQLAHNVEARTTAETNYVGSFQTVVRSYISTTWTQSAEQRNIDWSERAKQRYTQDVPVSKRAGSSLEGNKKCLVILVNFKDKVFETTRDDFDACFNEEGYNKNQHIGSVRDYFRDQSYGKLTIDFDVVGPYTVSQNMEYYGGNSSRGKDQAAREMVKEAIQAADEEVNFADYDWDGDGLVEQVFFIYAGYSEASGAPANTIWPHKSSTYIIRDGVTINNYACSNELYGYSGTRMESIGTICHEFSHCLGLPDFYDTTYSGGFGMGYWSIMDSGCYNYSHQPESVPGSIPCAYNAYERMFLGWLTPTELSEGVHISGMKAITDAPEAYIIYNEANRNEFYMLQNIQWTSWNKYAYGHGMLVMHVDYDQSAWAGNTVNKTLSHQRCTIIPADNNLRDLFGDPYPGDSNNHNLTNISTPAATLYNDNTNGKKLLNKPIMDIQEEDGLISFSFDEISINIQESEFDYTGCRPILSYTTNNPMIQIVGYDDSPLNINVGTYTSEIPFYIKREGEESTSEVKILFSYTINPAQLYITPQNVGREYGEDNPNLTITYSGFVNGEKEEVLLTAPTVSTTATNTSDVGDYPITASGGSAQNYTFIYESGTLTITKASLTAQVNNETRQYGQDNPAFTISYTGLKNGETEPKWTKALKFETSATITSNVGDYTISATGVPTNYDLPKIENGILSITKAPLTIKAKDYTIKWGDPMPEFEVSYEGLKNDETAQEALTSLSISCEATSTMMAFGSYDILVTATSKNYELTLVKGTLTITEPDSHTLLYLVDGEPYKSYTVMYGATITPETEPTKEGYTFSGWSEIPATMPNQDLTITGSFIVNQYTLTYKVDDMVFKTYVVDYGTAISPETEPTKEGYTFSGWSEIPDTMPAHDVEITGTFSINSYKLTYTVDGETYKTYEVEYGSTIIPEDEPTKEGYTFSGWSDIPETMPAHDVEITGTFSINSYKLTYTVDGETYKTYEVEYGSTIIPEDEPTKEGYTFSGWSEIPETMPSHDVVITGLFSVNSYTLTYEVDGEVYKTSTIAYGTAITPEAAPAEKEGYTFSGWSDIPETMPAHDVTVTGTFTINKYKLTYKVDGVEYKTYEVEYGAAITPEAEPTKEGYTFSGWSEIPEIMPAHDVTIYGTFTINKYKLTYKVDGEEYKSYELDYGSTITPEKEPTKEGYTFSGWSDIPETMPAHDVVVTGSFSVNSYKLTYMVDDKVYKETMYEYGATIIPEPQPEGDYATFEWIDLPQTMPAHDVVVYASYTTGIIEVLMATQRNIRIYSPNGKKLNKLQKGLNIVVLADGSVKKVVVK